MVTLRPFREAVSAKEALRELFLKRGGEVDADLAGLFIKELGVYAPGAFEPSPTATAPSCSGAAGMAPARR